MGLIAREVIALRLGFDGSDTHVYDSALAMAAGVRPSMMGCAREATGAR